jgi:hypothetical protein
LVRRGTYPLDRPHPALPWIQKRFKQTENRMQLSCHFHDHVFAAPIHMAWSEDVSATLLHSGVLSKPRLVRLRRGKSTCGHCVAPEPDGNPRLRRRTMKSFMNPWSRWDADTKNMFKGHCCESVKGDAIKPRFDDPTALLP